jgi:hypothetical protein
MKNKIVTLETYPQEYDEDMEGLDYWLDEHLTEFTITMQHLHELIKEDYQKLKDFFNTYTWDDTEWIYQEAATRGYIIESKIVERLPEVEYLKEVENIKWEKVLM